MNDLDHYDLVADVEKLERNVWRREDLSIREKQLAAATLVDVLNCIRWRVGKPGVVNVLGIAVSRGVESL